MHLGGDVLGGPFTPTARREAPHEVDTVTIAKRAPQLLNVNLRFLGLKPDGEQYEDIKMKHTRRAVEQASSGEDLSSQNETAIGLESDPDYLPSQTDENTETPEMDEEKNEEADEEEEVEEHTDLNYQIPEDVLRAAMQASPNTRASFFSTKMYRGPEDQSLSTHYCRTFEVAERVAQYFLTEKVLGFDIEWKPFGWPNSIKSNASLVQLACEDRIALFHISLFEGTTAEQLMPPSLKTILENSDILKVGVAAKGDFSRLQKYLKIEAQGVFELSRLHNLVEWHATSPEKVNNKLVGLAAQVLQHLQLPLYKGAPLEGEAKDTASVRESDWSKPLDFQQIQYAAADAYAGFRLYHMLEWKRKQLRPTPPTRGLCDYDAKAKPRGPTKKKARNSKDKKIVAAEQSTLVSEEELDDVVEADEEEEAYETAPEELEDPAETSAERSANLEDQASTDVAPAQRRVGRVNLSWLRGPDPGYPILPPESEKGTDSPDSSTTLKHPARSIEDIGHTTSALTTRLPTLQADEDDEFADPELEETLQIMDLDDEGKLTEAPTAKPTKRKRKSPRLVKANRTEFAEPVIAEQLKTPRPSTTIEMAATDSTTDVEMSDYNPLTLEGDEPATTSTPVFQPVPTPANDTSHSPQYMQATTWAEEYLRSTIPSPTSTAPSRIRTTIPHLRAYHLWYTQQLSLDDVAAHLRDPPLSHSTVTGYIMQAVTLERLEYDREIMRELMMSLPLGMRKGRWKGMAEKVDALK